MSSTCARTSGKVSAPSDGVRVPSAIVAGLWTVCSVRVRNDRVASSPSSGSTPITLQPGASALVTIALPESSPPPPHGTTTASSAVISSCSSSTAVAWPAITSRWSNGGISVASLLLQQLIGDRLARLGGRVVEDDAGAERRRRLALDRRRVGRHHDRRADAEQLPDAGHGLGVVARRVGDDAARPHVLGQRRDRVQRAAELEGTDALQVLALEEDGAAGARVERRGVEDGRAVGVRLEPPGRLRHLFHRRSDLGRGRHHPHIVGR